MKRITSILIVFTLLFVMLLTACGENASESANADKQEDNAAAAQKPTEKPSDKKVTISYWYTANEADEASYFVKWCNGSISKFMEANPNITIEKTVLSNSDQYQTKINASIASGEVPDIFQGWLAGRMEPFVKSGSIMALDDIINGDPELKDVFVPIKTGIFGGKTYGIGLMLTTEVYFYNKEIFKNNNIEVPKTYTELKDIIVKLKANNILPMAMGNKDPWVGTLPFMFIFDRIAGPAKYEETCFAHTGKFTEPEYAKAAEVMLEIANLGAYPDNFNTLDYNEAKAMFTSGKAAMYPMGTWELQNLGVELGDKLGFFNFPDIEGGKGSAVEDWIASQDNAFCVSAKAPKDEQDAAIRFLKYNFSKERLSDYANSGALLAPRNFPLDESKLHPATVELYKQLANVKHGSIPWDNPLGTVVGKELNLATQSIYAGKNINEVFANLQKIADLEWAVK